MSERGEQQLFSTLAREHEIMRFSQICKSLRYFSNPQHLHSLLLQSPQFFLSSHPTTLISSKSLLRVTSIQINRFCENASSYSQLLLISSSGYALTSSPTPSLCHSQEHSCLSAEADVCNSRYLVLDPTKNRNHWNRTLGSQFYMISSSDSSSFSSVISPHFNAYTKMLNIGSLKSYARTSSRLFSTSPFPRSTKSFRFGLVPNVSPKLISEIIEVIRSDESDMEAKLNLMDLRLSVASATEIFQVLNSERVSAMRFFNWIISSQSNLCRNYDICSLIIDNCGWLGEYEIMRSLLKDFNSRRLSLTNKAFGFVPVFSLSKDSIISLVKELIEMLGDVGGTCRTSGVLGLIEMFSASGSWEMAKSVMEITERKSSYFNILFREMCRKCNFQEARDLLDEMLLVGCDPTVATYNYLLSSLCKNNRSKEACKVFEEMQDSGCPPDALTFEIFIYYSCRVGKMDISIEFLAQMASEGLEPRFTTHAAFIKGYFSAGQYEEAYEYVVDSSARYKCSSNMIYSLLASLHQRKGNLINAQKILIEMIEKGLKPNFSVYTKVLKHLDRSGGEHLAGDLRSSFSCLSLQSSRETG